MIADYESKQALHIAQTTVVSLRERLEQKEETVARFEKLLNKIMLIYFQTYRSFDMCLSDLR